MIVATPGIGPGWRRIATELDEELGRRAPGASVRASLDDSGLLRLECRGALPAAELRRARRAYEARAAGSCEDCGSPARVAGGATVLLLCPGCSGARR